ncbi:MAG: ABC transporter permease [Lachnospiraceae bacterium]|nr:ABC transporter permease [Lachnospiraceae bacterium]
MNKFIGLTKRNLLIFFKDKQSVIFSLMTSIIVFVLYLLFLRGTFVDAIQSAMKEAPGLADLVQDKDVKMYANLTLLVGILGSALITVTFNCLTVVVRDKENKVDYDILSTPIRRWQVILSYFTAAVISAVVMTGIILTVGLLLLGTQGDLYMGAKEIAQAYGIVALGSFSATALFMIVVLFFKSSSACGAFFSMVSAAAGFVIGAYIPISQFSDGVQTVCNIFPACQVTILLRNALLSALLQHMDTAIGGLDNGMFVESIKETFSFDASLFGKNYGMSSMIIYVAAFMVLCVAVMIFVYGKTYKKK